VVTEPTNNQWMPFVVSPSNHERPFDRLRANGTEGGGFHCVAPTLRLVLHVIARSASDEAILLAC